MRSCSNCITLLFCSILPHWNKLRFNILNRGLIPCSCKQNKKMHCANLMRLGPSKELYRFFYVPAYTYYHRKLTYRHIINKNTLYRWFILHAWHTSPPLFIDVTCHRMFIYCFPISYAQWWHIQCTRYPLLYKKGKDIMKST